MTKSIETLVDDINGILKNGSPNLTDKALKELGKSIALKVKKHLSPTPPEETKKTLRMSNIGKGDRYLWYLHNTGDPTSRSEEFEPSRLFAFIFGDVIEELLFFLAEQSGHTVTNRQDKVKLGSIEGSMDGRIDGVGVDTKSAADFSFKKFLFHSLEKDDVYGYRHQLSGYFHGEDKAAFLVANKSTGEIVLDVHTREELPNSLERIKHLEVITSEKEPPNERCYQPVKHGDVGESLVLSAHCSRCPFKFTCWADANDGAGLRAFSYSGGPKYFVQLNGREPTVREVPKDDSYKSLITKWNV